MSVHIVFKILFLNNLHHLPNLFFGYFISSPRSFSIGIGMPRFYIVDGVSTLWSYTLKIIFFGFKLDSFLSLSLLDYSKVRGTFSYDWIFGS